MTVSSELWTMLRSCFTVGAASQMEDVMCYERDYKIFEDRKKAEATRVVQERRTGLIDRLLNAANKHGEAAKGLEGRVSGTDATTRPGNRRDGQLQVRAAGDLRWPL